MKNTTRLEIVPVWPDGVAGTENGSHSEQETLLPPLLGAEQSLIVRNVTQPTLLAYLPDPSVANGTAVIVCPGGCFAFLSIETEGTDVAYRLNERGVAVFVLKYRLTPTPVCDEEFLQQLPQIVQNVEQMMSQAPIGIIDGKQALKVVRERASAWGINPERIGILGFSGGGVITIAAATQYDADTRPEFAAPIYAPVWQKLTVPVDAPPLFIALANDDLAIADGSMPLYSAWKAAGHPVELHIYSNGGHGFGMTKQGLPSDHWIERFGEWLAVQDFLS